MRLQLTADRPNRMALAVEDEISVPAEDVTEPADTADDLMRWLLVVEGIETGDHRMIEHNAITWRDLPLPFMALDTTTYEHQEARLVANIVGIEREGPNVYGYTRFVQTDDPGILHLQNLIRNGDLRGVSVDMDSVDGYVLMEVPDEDAPIEMDDQGRVIIPFPQDTEVVTAARLMGATAVPFPAFAEAKQDDGTAAPVDAGELVAAMRDPSRVLSVRGPGRSLVAASGTSVVVVAVPADPAALAVEGGLPPEELHCTIGYYGKLSELDVTVRDSLTAFVDANQAGFTAAVGGIAQMGDDDPQAVVLLIEAPELQTLRDDLTVVAQMDMKHPHYVPHVTLGYGIDWPADRPTTIEFARTELWLGSDVYPMQGEMPDPAEVVEDVEVSDEDAALIASIVAPERPPKEWFDDPQLPGPTPLTVTDDGRVYGHAALWKSCHRGYSECTPPPRSPSQYAHFHTGPGLITADGTRLAVGHITCDGGHADERLSAAAARKHYDETGFTAADVRAGEDEYGIWIAGALVPGLDGKQLRKFTTHDVSGDWRAFNGQLDMISLRSVPVPGFVKTVYASGHMQTMIASMPVCDDTAAEPDPNRLIADRIALSIGRHRDQLLAHRDRLAFHVGRHPSQRRAELAARVRGGRG